MLAWEREGSESWPLQLTGELEGNLRMYELLSACESNFMVNFITKGENI